MGDSALDCFIVKSHIMARLKNVTFVKSRGILLRTVPSGEMSEMWSGWSPLP